MNRGPVPVVQVVLPFEDRKQSFRLSHFGVNGRFTEVGFAELGGEVEIREEPQLRLEHLDRRLAELRTIPGEDLADPGRTKRLGHIGVADNEFL